MRVGATARFGTALAIAGLLASFAGAASSHHAGRLDHSFSGDGQERTIFHHGWYEAASGVAIDSRGRIVTVGSSLSVSGYAAIARYRSDGSLDKSFSHDGMDRSGGYDDARREASSVAIDDRDRVVVAGFADYQGLFVKRYTSNGKTDDSFSSDGLLTDPNLGGALDVAIDDQGRIVVVEYDSSNSSSAIGVTRLMANGKPDLSFGENGHVTTGGEGLDYDPGAVAIDEKDRIVVGGSAYDPQSNESQVLAARFKPNGDLDDRFGEHGVLTVPVGNRYAFVFDLALSHGKVFLAGQTYAGGRYKTLLVGARRSGVVDRSFGKDGIVISGFKRVDVAARAVSVDSHRRIVLAGLTNPYNHSAGLPDDVGGANVVFRYRSDGSPDHSFSRDGTRRVHVGKRGGAYGVAIDRKDRILVAGQSLLDNPSATPHFSLVRLLGR